MTDSSRLERRYRRLLAFYPKAYRRDHEEEILAVLMTSAAEGQKRPRLAESINLLRNALAMRARQVPVAWEYSHRSLMLPVRVIVGIWLVGLTAVLYGYGHGGWWGVVLVPAATLQIYMAYRLMHPPRERRPG
jgi:hypothetical protein